MASRDTPNTPIDKLSEAQAKSELKRLAAEIATHDKHYYQSDAPKISDADYDKLRKHHNAIDCALELVM